MVIIYHICPYENKETIFYRICCSVFSGILPKVNYIYRQIIVKKDLVGQKVISLCNAGILPGEHPIMLFLYVGFKTSSVGNSPFVLGN